MIFIYEIPIMFFVLIGVAILGIDLIPIITIFLSISLVISIIWLFFADKKILNLIVIVIHILLLIFLNGRSLTLWDILFG